MLPAPALPALAPLIDRLLGRDLAADLAVLFDKVGASIQALLSDQSLAQIQAYLKRFLFEAGFQEIGVRVSRNATEVVIRHATSDSRAAFPTVAEVGDMDILSQFFPCKVSHGTRNSHVNQLRNTLCVSGMVPILIFAHKVREVVQLGVNLGGRTPLQHGQEILRAMASCFPAGNEFAAQLIDMSTVQIELAEVEGGYRGILRGEFNVDSIGKLYPSFQRLLSHLAAYEIAVLDPFGPGEELTSMSEADMVQGKCLMTVRITSRGSRVIEFEATNMVAKKPSNPAQVVGELLWFDRTTGLPMPFSATTPTWPVDFDENATGAFHRFRVVVHGTFRIPQLGCGSITAPTVIMEMRYRSSRDAYPHPYGSTLAPACKFDMIMLHMSEPSRITNYLIRPFINLDLLRYILLNHFHIQFEINPPRRPGSPVAHPMHPSKEAPEDLYEVESDDNDVDDGEYFDAHDTVVDVATMQAVSTEMRLVRAGSATIPTNTPTTSAWTRKAMDPWQLNFRFIAFLPPPPRVIASCLSMFVGEQLESPDELKMMADMMQALAADLKGVSARLAREQGDVAGAVMAEQDVKVLREQVTEHRKLEVQAVHEKQERKRRRRWLLFCG